MFYLIIVEVEFELVLESIRDYLVVVNYVRRWKKRLEEVILDSIYYYVVLKKFLDGDRCGRLDIVYICFFNVFESIVNKEGFLWVYVYMRNDEVIYIKFEIWFLRNYNRFLGFMESFFKKGVVLEGLEFLRIEKKLFEFLIEDINFDMVFIMYEEGELIRFRLFGEILVFY